MIGVVKGDNLEPLKIQGLGFSRDLGFRIQGSRC